MHQELSTRGLEREALLTLNRRASAISTFLVGPVVVANLAWQARVQPCWQFWSLAGLMLLTNLAWVVSYLLGKRGHMSSSAAVMMFSALLFDAGAMVLRQDTLAAAALADVGMVVYGWVFSPAVAVGGAVFSVLSLGVLRVLGHLGMLPAVAPVASLGVMLDLCIVVAVFPVAMYLLQRRSRIGERPYLELSAASRRQRQLFDAMARLQPQVAALIDRGENASQTLAAQSSQQAATAEAVESAMRTFGAMLGNARQAAQQTRQSAESSREKAAAGRDQLAAASERIERFVAATDSIKTSMERLAQQSLRTEEVIAFIRGVNEKLKVLSINAALEAARSGEAGRGFSVVAQQLRAMLEENAESLAKGRALLAGIGEESAKTLELTSSALQQLAQNVEALREARETIDAITGSIVGTAERVGEVAAAADQQQAEVERVSRAMAELRDSAGKLTDSAHQLSEGMEMLAKEQQGVRDLLARAGTS